MKRIPIHLLALLAAVALLQPNSAWAQKTDLSDKLTFEASAQPEDPFDPRASRANSSKWKARRGQVVRIQVVGTPLNGWYTYPITQKTPDQPAMTKWTIEPSPAVAPLWPVIESPALSYNNKDLKTTYFTFPKPFTWNQEIVIAENAPVGSLNVTVKLESQVCDKNTCNLFTHTITIPIEVNDESPLPISAEIRERIKNGPKAPDTKASPAGSEGSLLSQGLIRDSYEEYKARMDAISKQMVAKKSMSAKEGDTDLLGFILAGMLWGAISLVTPCVFPMIPITVSFFLKQSEKEHHRPIVMASVYSLTIVIVLTLAAAFLLSVFRLLSVHPVTNAVIGGLFVFFALSLFGMYEIELPQSLAQFTSAREGKGGMVGTVFMALTFTIISFACVAPFLGGFSGTAAGDRPWWHNVLGGLAFSVTFASPFFFLALFPALLRKMPKSGSWLNSVKVVMGFLELAAAFKFFRTAELILTTGTPSFFTFDLVLGLWIAMSVLCGLYLINAYRLPHDTPEEHITVPRLLFSAVFLALALYLTPALFKVGSAGQTQRPGGAVYAWIDSFLLPDSHEEDASTANLPYAVKAARDEYQRTGKPKRIFIDFTGVTCTNCKINEKNVFSKPQISKLFAPYLVVKLYTDTVPPENYATEARADGSRSERDAKQVNLPFQNAVFGTTQLPLYAVLEPQADGKINIIGVYDEGRINNETAFAEFLRNPEGK